MIDKDLELKVYRKWEFDLLINNPDSPVFS